MFSRRPDRPNQDPRSGSAPAPGMPSALGPGQWSPVPSPAADPVSTAAAQGDATVVGERDRLEGTLRSSQGVLVLGAFTGAIESESWVRLGERSMVTADITAQEVVVAGRCSGRIVASGRVELAATGTITGDIQTPRLQLHEGGVIDGGLYMTRTDVVRAGTGRSAAPAAVAPTPVAGPSAEPVPVVAEVPAAKPSSVREGSRAPSPRSGAASIPVDKSVPAEPAPEVPAAR